jgi:hypothetical protein
MGEKRISSLCPDFNSLCVAQDDVDDGDSVDDEGAEDGPAEFVIEHVGVFVQFDSAVYL